jgi:transposase
MVEFLEHLLRHIRRRPIMVFWDGGRPHHSDETRAFLRAHPRIEAHRFPGYSPELTPDEWVWRHLKNHELASYAPHDVKELSRELRRAVVRMRVRPKLIRFFVAATHLYD